MTALPTPRALLLDFGGVIVETRRRDGWADELAQLVYDQLAACHAPTLKQEDVRDDIVAGAQAASQWKNAMSRPRHPVEMTAREYWGDYVAGDWPEPDREVVLAHAVPLAKRLGELRQDRFARPGLLELFDEADSRGVRLGIVSNALSGAVHRDWMRAAHLDDRIAVEVYSDEVGLRKPNPDIIRLAARALDLDVAQTWYVGDNFDRDVVCGRRAGVGATILMEADGTYHRPYRVRDLPDAVVADPHGLRALLVQAVTG